MANENLLNQKSTRDGTRPFGPLLKADQLRSDRAGPFDLCLQHGERVCIVGRSGAGKSVFLRMLADLDPNEGVVRLDGQDCGLIPGPLWRRQVAYQAAEPAWWRATVREHIAPADMARAAALMFRLDLPAEVLDQPVVQLSTGQRQRLALVRSAALRPRVLLLDEPTASLDADSTARVEAAVLELSREGMGIVWVTRSLDQAERIGHRVLTLHAGKLTAR